MTQRQTTTPDSPVRIIVHRGTNAIGGTCVEIEGPESRLFLDIGMPIMENGGGALDESAIEHPGMDNGILPRLPELFDENHKPEKPVAGIVISHAHPDHYGLLNQLAPSVPVWMSRETRTLIEAGNIFYSEALRCPGVVRCHAFAMGEPFRIAEFCVTPHLVDHSAFGAAALLVEVAGRRILYTGDLRAHGRKTSSFRKLPVKSGHVDCMLMEGTTLGGKHHDGYSSEDEVEEGFLQHFSKNGPTFVLASGSNIDRTVSLYRACKRTGKTLVIDLYQFYLLDVLKRFSRGLPPHDGDHLRVFFERGQESKLRDAGCQDILDKARPREISCGAIIRQARGMVLRLSYGMMARLARKMEPKADMAFIYSMWKGYLDRGENGMASMPSEFGHEWKIVHTSGHAWLEDLQWIARKINPHMLVPIHTLQGDEFTSYFGNVCRIEDGEALTMGSSNTPDFSRGISEAFFNALTNSEWHQQFINDDNLFMALRDDSVDFYYQGCRLLHLSFGEGKPKGEIHHKYLVHPGQYFVRVDASGRPENEPRFIDLQSSDVVKLLKDASAPYAGKEKKGVHKIIQANRESVVDVEIAFGGQDRIDFAALVESDGCMTLKFFECKHFSNNAIRSNNKPKVLEQVSRYSETIVQCRDKIADAYAKAFNIMSRLKPGRPAHEAMRKALDNGFEVSPDVGLVIFGFDNAQKKDFSAKHLPKLAESADVWFIGEPGKLNLAKPHHRKEHRRN